MSRENLGLDPLNFNVRFVGLGGLSLRQQRRLRLSESQVQGASLVFLDIGTDRSPRPQSVPNNYFSHIEN